MYKQIALLICIMAMGLVAVSPSFPAIEGLVGAWLFDEGSGDKTVDSSGNGHDGKFMGNAKWEENGKFGSAVSCDGTEAYVMVPDHEDFEFDGDFSIACWFQSSVRPSMDSGLVTKGYDKAAGAGGDARPWYLVYFLTGGTVDLYLRDAGGANSRVNGRTLITDGEWHHVVAMKDGGEVKIYIDGEEDGVAAAVDAKYGENAQPLVFMVHHGRWFIGLMDEVAVFNKALSEGEIGLIMNGLDQVFSTAVDVKGKLAVTWGGLKSP